MLGSVATTLESELAVLKTLVSSLLDGLEQNIGSWCAHSSPCDRHRDKYMHHKSSTERELIFVFFCFCGAEYFF
jgi:hypothetical protein